MTKVMLSHPSPKQTTGGRPLSRARVFRRACLSAVAYPRAFVGWKTRATRLLAQGAHSSNNEEYVRVLDSGIPCELIPPHPLNGIAYLVR